jgi:hypothetical protein
MAKSAGCETMNNSLPVYLLQTLALPALHFTASSVYQPLENMDDNSNAE